MSNSLAPGNDARDCTAFRRICLAGVVLVAALGCTAGGCSQLTGTSGDEGTVDLVKSQEAAASNPGYAKKAAKLGGGLAEPPEKRRGKGAAK
jgi:hypothetical protein